MNQNLARAVGPAIGGLILAATSAGTVFIVNAATFLAVIAVVAVVSFVEMVRHRLQRRRGTAVSVPA